MRVNEGAARGPEGGVYHVSNQRCGSVLFTRRNRHAELTPCASPVTGWSEGLAARGQMAGSWRAATASDVMIQEALSCVSVGGDPAAEICPPPTHWSWEAHSSTVRLASHRGVRGSWDADSRGGGGRPGPCSLRGTVFTAVLGVRAGTRGGTHKMGTVLKGAPWLSLLVDDDTVENPKPRGKVDFLRFYLFT